MRAAAIYGRRSKGQEPAAQLERLRAAAHAEGFHIVLEASDVASGSNPNRPGWSRIMNAVKGGHVQAVWITKTDRAMRSTQHYLEAVESFLKRSCQLRILDQPMASVMDKDDPMSRAFRTIGAAFAQLERDLADERSNEGHQVIEGRLVGPSGAPVGRPRAYGEGHRMRMRAGSPVHDRPRCPTCRGETGGPMAPQEPRPENEGVAEPNGFAAAKAAELAGVVAGVQQAEVAQPGGNVEVAAGGKA